VIGYGESLLELARRDDSKRLCTHSLFDLYSGITSWTRGGPGGVAFLEGIAMLNVRLKVLSIVQLPLPS